MNEKKSKNFELSLKIERKMLSFITFMKFYSHFIMFFCLFFWCFFFAQNVFSCQNRERQGVKFLGQD